MMSHLTRHDLCLSSAAAVGCRIDRGNTFDLLVGGDRFVPNILAAIQVATKSIFVEMFTLRRGRLAQLFATALAERAMQGVTVTLLLDAFGSRFLPRSVIQYLRRSGVTLNFVNSLLTSFPAGYFSRDHRKIFVIDECTAFIGGMSIDDVFLGDSRYAPWHELMLRVSGSLVTTILQSVLETYSKTSGSCLPQTVKERGTTETSTNDIALGGDAIYVASGPHAKLGRVLYVNAIRLAKKSVQITTPYFVPEDVVSEELIRAVARNVDVRVITAGSKTNAKFVRVVAHAHYDELLAGGVRVFEYQPTMMHAKSALIDGGWWVVGSTNIDARSFHKNLEADVIGCDGIVAGTLAVTFADLERRSSEIRREADANRTGNFSLFRRCMKRLGRYL